MKVLFLGGNVASGLSRWLSGSGAEVIYTDMAINADYVRDINPDLAISYNYTHIVRKDVIDLLRGQIINLHISCLPWNRGTYPNVWSFLDDTPKGVTILWLTEEVDAGKIIAQKQIIFDEDKETLKTTYDTLHREIQDLFKANWEGIKEGRALSRAQAGAGSMHRDKDFREKIAPLLGAEGFGISIRELRDRYRTSKRAH